LSELCWKREGAGLLLDRPSIDDEIAELAALEEANWKPRWADIIGRGEPLAADTPLYRDVRNAKQTGDFGTISLSTTSLMIANPANGNWATILAYWDLGKRWKITVMGKMTTVLTPGNLTIEIRYGTTDNGGTILATSAATALTASKTNISFTLECYVRANAVIGTAAGLFAWGRFIPDQSGLLIPAANNPLLIPASAAAAVNVDTTVAGGVNIQMKRSGSTAETVTVQDLIIEALN
jgi:hypothetical protein